jgi:hypothetical protein
MILFPNPPSLSNDQESPSIQQWGLFYCAVLLVIPSPSHVDNWYLMNSFSFSAWGSEQMGVGGQVEADH